MCHISDDCLVTKVTDLGTVVLMEERAGELMVAVAAELRAALGRLPIGERPTHQDIADAIGRSRRQVIRMFKGERSMNVDELRITCRMLGTDVLPVIRAAESAAAPQEDAG